MKKTFTWLLFACFCCLSIPAFTQDLIVEEISEFSEDNEIIKCSAAEALKQSFGNIIVEKLDDSKIKITLSVPFTEIESMLTLILANNWYPENLVIKSASKDNAAIFLVVSKNENDSFRRFRVLKKLTTPGVLPWKFADLDDKTAYVTTIETDFGKDFVIKGETKKSGLIFTELTPRISKIGADLENLDSQRFASKKNFDRTKIFTRETYHDSDSGINGQPFFERGTYKEDSVVGRYMIFTLRCQW